MCSLHRIRTMGECRRHRRRRRRAWGWVSWGSSGCTSRGSAPPWRPRTLDAGIVAGGWRGGRLVRSLGAGGSPSAGRGGGEQAAQESAPNPGAGGGAGASPRDSAPGRTCVGQTTTRPSPTLPYSGPWPRTGRCPRCPQRGLSAVERGVCAGRAAPSAGARVMGR